MSCEVSLISLGDVIRFPRLIEPFIPHTLFSNLSRILVQPRKLPHGLTVRIGFDPKPREPVKPNVSVEEELLALKDRVEFKLVFYVDEDGEKNIPAEEGEVLRWRGLLRAALV